MAAPHDDAPEHVEHDRRGHDHGHHGHEHAGSDDERGRPAAGRRRLAGLLHLVRPHSHDAATVVDTELAASQRGMRALFLSFAALMVTALLQAVLVVVTGSVALLGDTVHNLADALTAIPIALAFWVARRPASRRYTYGYGRAEDVAGIVVVLVIAGSAVFVGVEALRRLVDQQPVDHPWLLAAAGIIGFGGNELVARYRMRVGRAIGSAALVADGLHARTDAFTSLAVVLSAVGALVGIRAADPVVGLGITLAIVAVLRSAAREVWHRLMDAVEPGLLDDVESVVAGTDGVRATGTVRLRWIGHALRAEIEVGVDPDLSVVEGHAIAEAVERRLIDQVPRLTAALVHAGPLPVTEVAGAAAPA